MPCCVLAASWVRPRLMSWHVCQRIVLCALWHQKRISASVDNQQAADVQTAGARGFGSTLLVSGRSVQAACTFASISGISNVTSRLARLLRCVGREEAGGGGGGGGGHNVLCNAHGLHGHLRGKSPCMQRHGVVPEVAEPRTEAGMHWCLPRHLQIAGRESGRPGDRPSST